MIESAKGQVTSKTDERTKTSDSTVRQLMMALTRKELELKASEKVTHKPFTEENKEGKNFKQTHITILSLI